MSERVGFLPLDKFQFDKSLKDFKINFIGLYTVIFGSQGIK